VIFKKMLLTGAMTIIAAGSSAQMVIALLIVLINLLLLLKLGPFVDETDDWLAFLTSMQMLLTLLGGLLLMTDDPTKPTYDSTFMGVTMVVVNSFGFFALLISLIMLHPKCRKRINGKQINTKTNRSKVRVTPNSTTTTTTTMATATTTKPSLLIQQDELDALKSWGMDDTKTNKKPKRFVKKNSIHFGD